MERLLYIGALLMILVVDVSSRAHGRERVEEREGACVCMRERAREHLWKFLLNFYPNHTLAPIWR
jgi:hypothetical protein